MKLAAVAEEAVLRSSRRDMPLAQTNNFFRNVTGARNTLGLAEVLLSRMKKRVSVYPCLITNDVELVFYVNHRLQHPRTRKIRYPLAMGFCFFSSEI